MKALVKTMTGPKNMEVMEIDPPSVKPGEVLIEVKAAGICGSDLHVYNWHSGYEFIRPPIVLGHEFAGKIVETKSDFENLKVGEKVTAEASTTCRNCYYCKRGMTNLCINRISRGLRINGAFAQYISVPADQIHRLPEGISYEHGALTEPVAGIVHAMKLPNISVGDSVAILGPGPMGLIATQLIKPFASLLMVTGLNVDEERLFAAKAMGADVTINVEKEDPVSKIKQLTNELGVDIVVDTSGSALAVKQSINFVKKKGKIVLVGISPMSLEINLINIVRNELSIRGSITHLWEDWEKALNYMESGKLNITPLITHRLPLDDGIKGFEIANRGEGIKVLLLP